MRILLFLFILSSPAFSDSDIAYNGSRGDGGGGYNCGAQFLSFDYVHSDHTSFVPHNFGSSSCKQILASIQERLDAKNPFLAAGLKDFIASIGQTKGKRVWSPTCEGRIGCLNPIDDDQVGKKGACPRIQVAERREWKDGNQVVTVIDQEALKKLESNPVQCSYFYLHEWARDFMDDAAKIRPFVHAMHSEDFFRKNGFQLFAPKYNGEAQACVDKINKSAAMQNFANYLDVYSKFIQKDRQEKFGKRKTLPKKGILTVEPFRKSIATPESLLQLADLHKSVGNGVFSFVETKGDEYFLYTYWPSLDEVK